MINITYRPQKSVITGIEVVTLDATISQQHVASVQVTESPIEKGAFVSDHAILKPEELTINGVITSTPTSGGMDESVITSTYGALVTMLQNRMTLVISTPLRSYSDMIMDSLNVPRDANTGGVFEFSAHFRQVIFVTTETTEEPLSKRRGGEKPKVKATDPVVAKGSVLDAARRGYDSGGPKAALSSALGKIGF